MISERENLRRREANYRPLTPIHFLLRSADVFPDDEVIAINLKGPLNLHRAVLPHMIRTGQGKIINIASDAGRVAKPCIPSARAA
jgi:NAD(P)-dependent dehydrogenase (short-subunit alcohol dehydrogenase family)